MEVSCEPHSSYTIKHIIVQILGFSTAGTPVLPSMLPTGAGMIRRDKLGWDEISAQSAKIVSFSGKFI